MNINIVIMFSNFSLKEIIIQMNKLKDAAVNLSVVRFLIFLTAITLIPQRK